MSERKAFLLPDLGEGLTQAEIVRWLVAVGDDVVVDQPVVEVETEKALVELPCPYGGTIVKLHGETGTIVSVGAPLVTVEVAAGAGGSGKVLVGYGTATSTRRRRRGSHEPAEVANREETSPVPEAIAPPAPAGPPRTTPPIRKYARELGVDLAAVTPTGLHGLITRADVDAFAPGAITEASATTDERIVVRGVRKAVADRLTAGAREIPQAATWIDADATELLAWRRSIGDHPDGVKVTSLALILRICVAGLQRYPVLNASFDAAAGEIVMHRGVHLGVAVQTERGLIVPVIRAAETRNAFALAGELERLSALGRDGRLAPSDLGGSTFTVSNFGAFGVDGGIALINPPEAGILGVGRIATRPWVVNGELQVRDVVQLSLGFDHRICDGRDAAGFLRFVADGVERPGRLFASL